MRTTTQAPIPKLWFSPGTIRFSREQMCFLLKYLDLLETGGYPPEGVNTGYTGNIAKRIGHHAPFEIPIQLHAEVTYRLNRTGIDGELLLAEITAEYMVLSEHARRSLNYISGWRRRSQKYKDWIRQQNYRHNKLARHPQI